MKFKKTFLVICVIICLFTMASVCASEVDDAALASGDKSDIGLSQINEMENDNLEITEVDTKNSQINEDDGSFDALGGDVDDGTYNALSNNLGSGAVDGSSDPSDNNLGSEDDLVKDIIALNVTVEQNTSFILNVDDGFKGNVSIEVEDNVFYNGTVKTLIIGPKLLAGDKTATIVFYDENNYEKLTCPVTFSVSRVAPSIDVTIDDVTYPNDALAHVEIGNYANGTVNITVDGKVFNGTVYNGIGDVALSDLSAGYKDAKVEFFSDDDYNDDVNASQKFIVYPNNSLVEIRCDSSYNVGEPIEISITTHNSTGDLKVYLNGEENATLYYVMARTYTVDLDNLKSGTYIFSVVLDKDQNYTGYSTSVTFNVVKKDLAVSLSDMDGSIVVGSPVRFTAKLNETVSGDVIFEINGANYTVHVSNEDSATYEYTPADNSSLTVIARFAGNDAYNINKSEAKTFAVDRIHTDIDVSANSPKVGENADITITMNPEISTNVKLVIAGKEYDVAVVNGLGTYSVSGLAYGSYTVEVSFAGDDKYLETNNETAFNVNKVEDYNISVSVSNIFLAEDETIVVVLPADIDSSQLTVKVDGDIKTPATVVNGIATIIVPGLTVGSHEVNVSFAGDAKYGAKESNSNVFHVYNSSGDFALVVENHTFGENTIFKAVLNNDVTENIAISIDGAVYSVKPDDGGIAILTLDNLTGGWHVVNATYPGDEKYPNCSKSGIFFIPRAQSSISVDFAGTHWVGDDVLINVTVGQPINGTVKLIVGGVSYCIDVKDGLGAFTVRNLASGTYNVKAVFMANENYSEFSSNPATLEVKKIKTQLTAGAITATYNIDKQLVITLKDSKGNALSGLSIKVLINGKTKSFTTDKNGQVKVSTNGLVPKAYTASISFGGNAKYDKSTKSVKVTVKKASPKLTAAKKTFKKSLKTKSYTVTLKTNNNKVMKGIKLTLKVNGKTYSAKTNSKGQATFKITNLKKNGTFKAVVKYAGNACYNAKTVNTKIIVK